MSDDDGGGEASTDESHQQISHNPKVKNKTAEKN